MKRRALTTGLLVTGFMAMGTAVTGCSLAPTSEAEMAGQTDTRAAMEHELTVFRSPTCGCCGQWIEHMKAAGFQVRDTLSDDMTAIKQQYGVPARLGSCHTTVVNGYVVEGHIPAADVQRLLAERPEVAGIAVPGMPIGSPGMESGDYVEPYTVFSFTESGAIAPFADHS